MKLWYLFLVVCATGGWAQTVDSTKAKAYLEDQIYMGLSYINLVSNSSKVNANGFSNSFSFGFIKDFPFTIRGNVSFGAGLGYGRNTYYQNIKLKEVAGITTFEPIEDASEFKNNKFSAHLVELPIELRWRTSTYDSYKFWRIYAGVKFGYVFTSNAKFKGTSETIKIKGINAMNKLQYGATFSAGYGTWTFNFYYGLHAIFKNAKLPDDSPLDLSDFRLGLIFYIL
ncbi:PorT family protein [Flavobacteriaceae bacterium F08102]|nr:PorT family protein [Flavobacteriaceae bacterium F08102]